LNVRIQDIMEKASIIYEETTVLTAKFYHPKSDDYLQYTANIQIKDSGKNPVELGLKFIGIPPYAAPMPPDEHTIKASSILDLCVKVIKWFKKYGYELR
jgi:hypothetical protein